MFIAHAAVMFQNGEVVEGIQYRAISALVDKIGGEHINGFLTSLGEFVLPRDAAVIAFESGQVKEPVEELSPDDIWPPLITD